VTAGLLPPDQDPVLIVTPYAGQAAEIGHISVNRKGLSNYVNATLSVCLLVEPGKLIGQPAAALPTTYD